VNQPRDLMPNGQRAAGFKIVVDADSCPVKAEVCRVAERYGIKVTLVANQPGRPGKPDWITEVEVSGRLDAADDWIADHLEGQDIVISTDIPLADRCIKKGARVLTPNGVLFNERSIGTALATRDLMTHLRDVGLPTRGSPPFGKADRSRFLQALDKLVQDTLKGKIER
jgi:uncharacterized protein YaiI (UPF0178 family)